MQMEKKPWSGRFREATDKNVEAFTSSIHFDKRLYRYDIEGSIAHAKMLSKQGIIKKVEEKHIIAGLKEILVELQHARFVFEVGDEDIHMAIEKALVAKIGEAGEKLHTARSRNDQIALDIRLYIRDEIGQVVHLVKKLKGVIITLAKKESKTIMPGYTHLQKAQPVLLAHHLLAYWEMLDRDEQRLMDCLKRVNVMPLGSAALAGTTIPIDREFVAKQLKFPKISQNSMDAVSDRDFVIECIFVLSVIMMHMSRFSEDIILWASDEFRFVEIADAFTTGSSIMPQKKNPDVAELIRGKTGRVYGDLIALLTIMKGLPMTYNRDIQEDKEPLFDAVDTTKNSLQILSEMVRHLRFNRTTMRTHSSKGFSMATDMAEYLVMKGLPFREAHRIVGTVVSCCIEKDKDLSDLTLKELRSYYRGFEKDIFLRLSVEHGINARDHIGGTAQKTVLKRIHNMEGQK
jgi:argininosuccinate lyase